MALWMQNKLRKEERIGIISPQEGSSTRTYRLQLTTSKSKNHKKYVTL